MFAWSFRDCALKKLIRTIKESRVCASWLNSWYLQRGSLTHFKIGVFTSNYAPKLIICWEIYWVFNFSIVDSSNGMCLLKDLIFFNKNKFSLAWFHAVISLEYCIGQKISIWSLKETWFYISRIIVENVPFKNTHISDKKKP